MEISWYLRAPNVGVCPDWKRGPLSHYCHALSPYQLMLFPAIFLLLILTEAPCLQTVKSTPLEGYLRKEPKGPCNSRLTISLHTIEIKPISSKGTAAVVKNLQQDLPDFSLWQLKGFSLAVKEFLS